MMMAENAAKRQNKIVKSFYGRITLISILETFLVVNLFIFLSLNSASQVDGRQCLTSSYVCLQIVDYNERNLSLASSVLED